MGRTRRYAAGAAGGVALTAAAITGLQVFQTTKAPTMTPSIAGASLSTCTTDATVTTCSAPPGTGTGTGTATTPGFRNGIFAARGHYLTPGGDETIGVRLTVSAGRVTRSEVRVEATSPTAQQFQRQFASRYAPQVVSRDLASLDLARVAGASLTSLGFDNALQQIQEAARDQR